MASAERKDIVFIGGYRHSPNIDAVRFFVTEIMPLLRKRLPGIRFYAAGSNPTAEVQSLASEDVVIAGYIEDLDTLLDRMRVSVAPLRYGAGIKGKIASAMSVGLPVVATSIAIEGIPLTDGENVVVADAADHFASSIARVYEDESVWNTLSRNGIAFADNAWGPEAAWKNLSDILARLGFTSHRNGRPLRLYSSGSEVSPVPREEASVYLNPFSLPAIGASSSEDRRVRNLSRSVRWRIGSSRARSVRLFRSMDFACHATGRMPLQIVMGPAGLPTGHWAPNWRETLTCPLCGMNNRQRLIATLVKEHLDPFRNKSVYLMEQVTPFFQWAVAAFPQHHVIGSEYLGESNEGGRVSKGIRHEDLTNLSFLDDSLDLIVSNDVLEHVPNRSALSPSVRGSCGAAERCWQPCRFMKITTSR
jgi:hypothetical protein